jgi:hypothetical protein
MKIVDIANEIFIDSGSPTDNSIPAIAFWIRGKIGSLNTLLYESFQLNETTLEILTSTGGELAYEAVAVIKQMYRIYDYEVQIRKNMNALASDNLLSISDQGTTITRVNRNSISQTYSTIRKDEIKMLTDLINAYRNRQGTPLQVAGDDTEVGTGGPDYLTPYPNRRNY